MTDDIIKTALVIDDSAEYCDLLISFFGKAYPDVVVNKYDPANGRPADNYAWGEHDLLILDYDLGPVENGLDWLRKCKTSDHFPPTIILTAHDDEEIVVNAMRFGAQGYLRKQGLTKGKLQDAIKNAFGKYKDEKQQSNKQRIHFHYYNKEKFFESLGTAKKYYAVYLIEIDKFHNLREKIGIFESDNFVNYVTGYISEFIKEKNYAGSMTRIGDSTITLLITNNKDSESCEKFAADLCNKFKTADYSHANEKIEFSVNIGATCIMDETPDVKSILKKIEASCRLARKKSGNSYDFYKDASKEEQESEQRLNDVIVNAFKENKVKPLFQSLILVSENTNTLKDLYHVRAKLLDPDNNMMEAKEYMQVLHKTKKLILLDRWLIRHCLGELSRLNKHKMSYGIITELSEESIHDKDLTDWIGKLIEHFKIHNLGSSLIFQIKAVNFLKNIREAKLQINKLRVKHKAPIMLSHIEDAETLDKCLQQEKFDYIMFPPEHTAKGKMDIEIMEKIINGAKRINAFTIASKIDSGEYLAMSATAGVDYVLGHFVQPPTESIMMVEMF